MATTFTAEEVEAAVEQFLLSAISVPTTKTGARDVLTLKTGVYDLLTTALLLRPESYFYVIYLARNRLAGLLQQQIDDLTSITGIAPNSTRPAKKINSTTDLANAQAALLDLTAGLNSRTSGVRGSLGPSVDRFSRSVSGFVSGELTKNVVVAGNVTPTGEEIRSTISATWSRAIVQHEHIVELATNIANALSALESVKLPESSIRDIVGRISSRLGDIKTTMEGDAAIAQSRKSMLDLLTMRTLVTKASTFTNPELVLMPLRGDSNLISFIDSPGVEASISGNINGPYNYDPASSLALSVNGSPVSVTLPRGTKGSRAELRSKVLSPWVIPTPGDQIAFAVNRATLASVILAAYANGPAAAIALNAGLSATMAVTWDAGTSQLVFQSKNPGDTSHLRLLFDTSIRIGGRDWAFPITDVVMTEVAGQPVPASEIIQAIATQTTLVSAANAETILATFTGQRTATGGEEAILWNRLDSNNDLVSTGVAAVTSPSRNFELLGVKPGMALHTTAPTAVDYAITAVSGNSLTLDPAPPAGTLTYYLGPDYRTLPDGARVQLTSGGDRNNSGFYRVAAGGGQVARVLLDRNIFSADSKLIATVATRLLSLTARGTTTSSGIGTTTPSPGATALGLTITAGETRPQLTILQLQGAGDFLLRNVRAGDVITLTSPTSLIYNANVVGDTSSQLTTDGGVPYEAGSWTFIVSSARSGAYVELQTASNVWLASAYVVGFNTLDTLVGRLIRGARYTGDIMAGLVGYATALATYQDEARDYVVPREQTIDNVVRTMREQGFDRALDLFLTLDVGTLFTMDDDGVSYATWLVRTSATAAREVVPVSKLGRGQQIIQEWRNVSFQPNPFEPGDKDVDP